MAMEVPRSSDVEGRAAARRQWGVLSLAELRACGLTSDAIVTAGAQGRICTACIAVCTRSGIGDLSLDGRWLAAVRRAGPCGAQPSSPSLLVGIVSWDGALPRGDCVGLEAPARGWRVTARRSGTTRSPGARSIWVTAPARTLLDLAARSARRAALARPGRRMSLRLIDLRRLAAALQRTGRGAAAAARHGPGCGPARTRSELEDVVLELLRRVASSAAGQRRDRPRRRCSCRLPLARPRHSKPTARRGTSTRRREDDARARL